LHQDLLRLQQPRLRLLRGDSIAPVFVEIIRRATAKADNHASLTEVVDEGHLLGQPDRVMQGHLGYRKADANPPGAGGDGRCKSQRIHIGAATIEVVLSQPEDVEAQGITELGLTERLIDDDVVGIRELALRKKKITKLHGISFRT
jgi:hypothetical protein